MFEIKGNISDSSNKISNAKIDFIAENTSTISDSNGQFTLDVKDRGVLRVSKSGYISKHIPIELSSTESIDVELITEKTLATQILSDKSFDEIEKKIFELFENESSLSAGSSYGQVWIRDTNIFWKAYLDAGHYYDELCKEKPKAVSHYELRKANLKKALIDFLKGQDESYYQAADKEPPNFKPDVEVKNSIAGRIEYISENLECLRYTKSTIETDQETSLIQLICKYIQYTGEKELFSEVIDGKSVIERIDRALDFLMSNRWADEPGFSLLYGGVTVDWGDNSPDGGGCPPNTTYRGMGSMLRTRLSHVTCDIYDNAMLYIALDKFLSLINLNSSYDSYYSKWQPKFAKLKDSIKANLWDSNELKFIPHLYPTQDYPKNSASLYLKGSPWAKLNPEPFIDGSEFNESRIFFHGGTGVAILADLLNHDEVVFSLKHMMENAEKAYYYSTGNKLNYKKVPTSVGLTLFPPYPQNVWQTPYLKKSIGAKKFYYQNGGDWTWFGAIIATGLVKYGLVENAYFEIKKMIDRVNHENNFYEWWSPEGNPTGSTKFRASAGALYSAIKEIKKWALQVN